MNYTEVLEKYKRTRSVALELNNSLLKLISKKAIESTAKKWGIWQDGTLVLEIEDYLSVLMDYVIYDCFQNGRNAVEHYLLQSPPELGTDVQTVLDGMHRAFFSIFRVEKIVESVGIHVLDILSDRRYFLVDVGLGDTATETLTIISRVLLFDDFIMTTGAALPVDEEAAADIVDYLNSMEKSPLDRETMTREELADLNASLIGFCLRSEGGQYIQYKEPKPRRR